VFKKKLLLIQLFFFFADAKIIERDLKKLYHESYRSLAIVLVHSYTFPDHERLIARSVGFTQISESAQLLPMINMVPRGVSSTADAYLTPILREYLDGFFNGFDAKLKDGNLRSPRIECMGSEIASLLGIKTILIHRYSSILSAYGLALADR
jgi:5-oxoprolinase (ATP-hydrolysing)